MKVVVYPLTGLFIYIASQKVSYSYLIKEKDHEISRVSPLRGE